MKKLGKSLVELEAEEKSGAKMRGKKIGKNCWQKCREAFQKAILGNLERFFNWYGRKVARFVSVYSSKQLFKRTQSVVYQIGNSTSSRTITEVKQR